MTEEPSSLKLGRVAIDREKGAEHFTLEWYIFKTTEQDSLPYYEKNVISINAWKDRWKPNHTQLMIINQGDSIDGSLLDDGIVPNLTHVVILASFSGFFEVVV